MSMMTFYRIKTTRKWREKNWEKTLRRLRNECVSRELFRTDSKGRPSGDATDRCDYTAAWSVRKFHGNRQFGQRRRPAIRTPPTYTLSPSARNGRILGALVTFWPFQYFFSFFFFFLSTYPSSVRQNFRLGFFFFHLFPPGKL